MTSKTAIKEPVPAAYGGWTLRLDCPVRVIAVAYVVGMLIGSVATFGGLAVRQAHAERDAALAAANSGPGDQVIAALDAKMTCAQGFVTHVRLGPDAEFTCANDYAGGRQNAQYNRYVKKQ